MTEKTCPFHQGFRFDTRISAINVSQEAKKCDGKDCQLWVKVGQDRIIVAGTRKFADPNLEYHYEGCGLLQVVPWELVKKEEPKAEVKP